MKNEIAQPPPEDPRTDYELITAVKQGQFDAFGTLYERHRQPIVDYLTRKIGDIDTAVELTQTTFTSALGNINTYKVRENIPVAAWFTRIAHNNMANYFRDRDRHPAVAIEGLTLRSHENIEDKIITDEDKNEIVQRVRAILNFLSEDERNVAFAKMQGMSNEAIQSMINRDSVGAVKAFWHRTCEKFKTTWQSLEGLTLEQVRERLNPEQEADDPVVIVDFSQAKLIQ